jgi:hypothetical protein
VQHDHHAPATNRPGHASAEPDQHVHQHAWTISDADPDQHAGCYEYANAYEHPAGRDKHTNAYAHTHANPDADAHADAHANQHADTVSVVGLVVLLGPERGVLLGS